MNLMNPPWTFLVYAGHSFRIGAATTASYYGIPEALIKTMGRWESAAYLLYIRTPREQLCTVARSKLCHLGLYDIVYHNVSSDVNKLNNVLLLTMY